MFIKLRKPYPAESGKNYVVLDFESDTAEIVLHNIALLPFAFEQIVKRFLISKTEQQ